MYRHTEAEMHVAVPGFAFAQLWNKESIIMCKNKEYKVYWEA